MSKALVCSCEDVTVEDVEASIAKGYYDIESVKRYTGFGTGICQGKSCLAAVAKLIAGEYVAQARITSRVPLRRSSAR